MANDPETDVGELLRRLDRRAREYEIRHGDALLIAEAAALVRRYTADPTIYDSLNNTLTLVRDRTAVELWQALAVAPVGADLRVLARSGELLTLQIILPATPRP